MDAQVVDRLPTMRRRVRLWGTRQRRRTLYAALLVRNRIRRSPAVGDAEVVVSLATHGRRIAQSFQAIESIAGRHVRPRRLIVCLPTSAEGSSATLPAALQRLERRGVEFWWTTDRGPHNKYFPYVASEAEHAFPLVTADDDCFYPRRWLADLLDAHRQDPRQICAPRCRTMAFAGTSLAPYASWPLATSDRPSPRRFFTGTSGVLYPRQFLALLRQSGDPSGGVAGLEDDIWINAIAAGSGTPVRQLRPRAQTFLSTVRSGEGLFQQHAGRKDMILEATYGVTLLEALSRVPG